MSPAAGGNRKDKSLRIMSQKFVMLFLVSRTLTVTLDTAAKILIDESQDSSSHSKYKSKERGTSTGTQDCGKVLGFSDEVISLVFCHQLRCVDCTTSPTS